MLGVALRGKDRQVNLYFFIKTSKKMALLLKMFGILKKDSPHFGVTLHGEFSKTKESKQGYTPSVSNFKSFQQTWRVKHF